MVYFSEVRKKGKKWNDTPNKAEIEEMYNTAVKVNEFVANEKELNPYIEIYEMESKDYAQGKRKESAQVMKVGNKYRLTPEEKNWIRKKIENSGFVQRGSTFHVPIECKGMKTYPNSEDHEVCMKKWKRKIDVNIPEFRDYDVDLRSEY
jgi:hypothetical protein